MLWHDGRACIQRKTDSPSYVRCELRVSVHSSIVDWYLVLSWHSWLYRRARVSFSVSEYSLCQFFSVVVCILIMHGYCI